MKIFYLTSVLGDSGGSEIYTRDLILELISRGHEVCVCTTIPYKVKGAKMAYLPRFGHHAFWKFEAPFFYRRALKAALEFKPDLIQSHSNSMMGCKFRMEGAIHSRYYFLVQSLPPIYIFVYSPFIFMP